MPVGKVTRWLEGRGFGFITPDDGGPDVFCHVTRVQSGRIGEGDAVEYSTQIGERSGKFEAINVTVSR